MRFEDIIAQCSKLSVIEDRCCNEEYRELVFLKKDLDQWSRIFTDILGPAVKPAGENPTEDDLRLTKTYGGVNECQTLFKREFEYGTVIVMFWPWQDNARITLKMALLKNKSE